MGKLTRVVSCSDGWEEAGHFPGCMRSYTLVPGHPSTGGNTAGTSLSVFQPETTTGDDVLCPPTLTVMNLEMP